MLAHHLSGVIEPKTANVNLDLFGWLLINYQLLSPWPGKVQSNLIELYYERFWWPQWTLQHVFAWSNFTFNICFLSSSFSRFVFSCKFLWLCRLLKWSGTWHFGMISNPTSFLRRRFFSSRCWLIFMAIFAAFSTCSLVCVFQMEKLCEAIY